MKYASGETPAIGDVVRHVHDPREHVVEWVGAGIGASGGWVFTADVLELVRRAPTREEIAEVGGVSLDAVPMSPLHLCGAECATCEPTPREVQHPYAPQGFRQGATIDGERVVVVGKPQPRDSDGPPRHVPRTEADWSREPVRAFDRHHLDPTSCRRCGATSWRKSGLCNGCDR
jgi:hypothetical protein